MDTKKRKILISSLLVVFLCVGGICYYFFYNNTQEKSAEFKEDSTAVGYNSKVTKPKDFTKNQIALPGFSNITVGKGAERANLSLFNPSFNEVYLKYKVIFKNTGKVLLETDAIAPGKTVEGFSLPKDLAVGEYPISIEIKTYDLKTKTVLNGGESNIKLTVK
ncbi:hypothetical protein LWX64_002602 [Enterococcus faecalis]|nr:hypothetical protein [Enterococcus faecalis]